MTWLVIRAFLGGALQKVWTFLCHRSFWQLAFGAALLLAGWEYLGKRTEQRLTRKVETQLSKTVAAREADRAAYVKAQADAAVRNSVQVAKVEQQSKKVSEDERQAYLRDLAQLRADRLRQQNTPSQGAPGRSGSPPAPASPGGTHADGLQVSPGDDVHEDAAEIELRLMHIQRWVEQQLAIDPNAPVNSAGGK